MALTSHSAGQKMSEDWLRFDGTEKKSYLLMGGLQIALQGRTDIGRKIILGFFLK